MSEIRRPDSIASPVAISTTPMPPIWIRERITAWPNTDQPVAVSRTTSPVTQTAEVAVNSEVPKLALRPSAEAAGIMSSSVPARITVRNPNIIT